MPADLPDAARRIGEAHAARDRDDLARLVREGVVRRDASLGANVPGAATFRADVERRVRGVNTAIRPKRKKGRRR